MSAPAPAVAPSISLDHHAGRSRAGRSITARKARQELRASARPDGTRDVPHLERQTAAAGRYSTLRLPAGELLGAVLGLGRHHQLLHRPNARPHRPDYTQPPSREALRVDRIAPHTTRQGGSVGFPIVVRRLDQVARPLRRRRQFDRIFLFQGSAGQPAARPRDSRAYPWASFAGRCNENPSTTTIHWRTAASPKPTCAPRSRPLPAATSRSSSSSMSMALHRCRSRALSRP